MSLRVKLLLGFLIVLVFAGGKGYFAVQTITSTGQLAMDIYDRQLMAISFSKSAMIDFDRMDRVLVQALTGEEIDDKEELLEELDDSRESLLEDVEVAATRLATADSNRMGEEIKAGLNAWRSVSVGLIEGKQGAEVIRLPEDLLKINSDISEKIEALVDHANEQGYIARENASASVAIAEKTNLIGIAVFFAIGLMIAYCLLAWRRDKQADQPHQIVHARPGRRNW